MDPETVELLRVTLPEPVPFTDDLDWMARAACAGMDVELFFARTVVEDVAEVCLYCSVRAECLGMVLALSTQHTMGFWAGTSHKERKRLARERRATELPRVAPESFGASGQVSDGETPVIAGQPG